MNKFSKYVGLDVHQETIAVALADTAGEVRYMGEIIFNMAFSIRSPAQGSSCDLPAFFAARSLVLPVR